MNVLLINPPYHRLIKLKAIYFPTGLGYVAASLSNTDVKCFIYNGELPREKIEETANSHIYIWEHHNEYIYALQNPNHPVWRETEEVLLKIKPAIVGITVMSAKYGSALKISSIVKNLFPECKVAWGGPHPTIQPEEVIQESNVDFVIRGEGEEIFSQLCEALKNGDSGLLSDIKGLSFKKDNQTFHNPLAKHLDIDGIPWPARDLVLEPELYTKETISKMIISRGCPFQCGFCSMQATMGRKVRRRNTDDIIKELKYLTKQYHPSFISFIDDTFTVNRNAVMELCEKIISEHILINWDCTTRADVLDEELISKMAKAGCVNMSIGIESGSPRILEYVNKGITLKQVKQVSSLLNKYGITWDAFFMIGFPQET